MTAEASGAVLTLTVRWAGNTGNHIEVQQGLGTNEDLPRGLSMTIGTGTLGTGEVALTPSLAALGSTQYHSIGQPLYRMPVP